jgi:hypothetical protein
MESPSPSSRVARVLLAVVTLALWACDGEDAPPVVQGRDDIVGPAPTTTSAPQTPPPAETPDASSDSPYGVLDDGGYGQGYAYSPLAVCKQCACEAGTYCFGGGTGFTTFGGTCTSAGSALGIGCQSLPVACASQPTCDCLFNALQGQIPCYLVCTGVSDLTAYCPSP